MLILTRRVGEGLIVGDQIRLVVLEIRGKQLRLGIEAPPGVVVLREEVFERLARNNLAATQFLWSDLLELGRVLGRRPAPPPAENGAAPCLSVCSGRLGRLTVSAKQVIEFPAGLPGMPQCRRCALILVPQAAPLGFLQSLEDPALGFPVADPAAVFSDFRLPSLGSGLKHLAACGPQDLQVLVVLTIPPGRPTEATANLQNPILLNPHTQQGRQVVVEHHDYSQQHRILNK